MKQLADYSNDDAASRGYGDGNVAFANGEGAMYRAVGARRDREDRPDLELATFPLPMTDDPDDLKVRVNLDLALWVPEASTDKEAARTFVSYLMQQEVMDEYNAEFLGFGTTTDAAPVTDERILGMQEYYDDGAFYQGLSRSIPLTIPIDNYIQTMATGGDIPRRSPDRRRLGRLALRGPDRRLERTSHVDSHHTAAASAGSLVDEAEHGHVDHLAGAPMTAGTPAGGPDLLLFLIPTLVLFTLAITVPAVLGIFYSFTELHRVRRLAVHRAHQLHRRVLRPGDPRELLVHLRLRDRDGAPRERHRVPARGRPDLAHQAEDGPARGLRDPDGDLGHRHRLRVQLPVLELAPGARDVARHPLAVGVDPRQPRPRLARDRHRDRVAVDPRHAPHLHRRAALHPGRGLRGRRHRRRQPRTGCGRSRSRSSRGTS